MTNLGLSSFIIQAAEIFSRQPISVYKITYHLFLAVTD